MGLKSQRRGPALGQQIKFLKGEVDMPKGILIKTETNLNFIDNFTHTKVKRQDYITIYRTVLALMIMAAVILILMVMAKMMH